VSLCGEADVFLVACRTGTRRGTKDVAMVVLDASRAGVETLRLYDTMTSAFLPIGEMSLRNVRIEADEVLAPPGSGFQAALGAIDVARTDIAAIAVGLAAQALDTALAYTRDRAIFGGTVLDLQGIQFALADVETDIVAGRLLYERAAALLGTPEGAVAAAHAKRFNPDMALKAAIECAETLGYIVTDDMPYLVDSVTMELNRHAADITLIVHPVLAVRRDVAGTAHGIRGDDPGTEGVEGALPESWIHVEAGNVANAHALAADLRRVLDDLRVAMEDQRRMRGAARELVATLADAALTRDLGAGGSRGRRAAGLAVGGPTSRSSATASTTSPARLPGWRRSSSRSPERALACCAMTQPDSVEATAPGGLAIESTPRAWCWPSRRCAPPSTGPATWTTLRCGSSARTAS